MCAFVDRPISEQDRYVQLCVWAMRQWIKAAVDGRCVCHVISGAFGTAGVARAAAPFHVAMRTLYGNARIPLQFGSIDRPSITESEALIVEAAAAAAEGRTEDLRAVARGLVFPDMAAVLARSLASVAAAFAEADLSRPG
jgi:hypothetical protein